MKFWKNIFAGLAIGLLITAPFFAFAQEKNVLNEDRDLVVYFFYSKTCPHCVEAEKFLEQMKEKYPQIEIRQYEASKKENTNKLMEMYQAYGVEESSWGLVPVTFIGNQYIIGYQNDKITGAKIEECIKALIKGEECLDNEGSFWAEIGREFVKLPFIKEISLAKLSPLSLAVVLGILDGFNACAMVALGLLLSVLIGTGIRKRVILVGGVFIFVSGLVYFFFISAWLNLFLALEQIKFLTHLTGVIIIAFAILVLREYIHNIVCKVCETDPAKQGWIAKTEQKLFIKMKTLIESDRSLIFVLAGVALVAAGINLVELACSLGFPLAFTRMLSQLELKTSTYYFYLLVYIIFYMLDDFIIFLIALFTLKITQVSEKYLKAIKLISGLLLLALGVIMIFKPEILALG